MKHFLIYIAITAGLLLSFTSPAYAHNPGAFVFAAVTILLGATVVSTIIKFLVVRYLFKGKNHRKPVKYILTSVMEFILILVSFSTLVELKIIGHTALIFAAATLLYLLPVSVINNLLLGGDLNFFKSKKWLKPLALSLIFPVVSSIVSTFTLVSLYAYFE